MTTILVVRHGETDWNKDGRVQGFSDIPMSDAGRAQVERTARMLQGTHVDALYSSDLERALETARILNAGRDLPIQTTAAFRERCWGAWEGRTMEQLAVEDPNGYARLKDGDWIDPSGSDDYETVQARVVDAFSQIAADHAGQTVLIATHGGPVKILTAWVLGAPVAAHHRMRIGNASVTTFVLRDRFVLDSYNVTPAEADPVPQTPARTLIESSF